MVKTKNSYEEFSKELLLVGSNVVSIRRASNFLETSDLIEYIDSYYAKINNENLGWYQIYESENDVKSLGQHFFGQGWNDY